MSDNLSQLNGGRFLADLWQRDSLSAAFFQKMINAINKIGNNTGTNAVGDAAPPPPIDNVNVSAANEMIQVTLNHNHPVSRAISYFVEHDTNPNFTQPTVIPLGPSRTTSPFTFPTFDSNGSRIKHYFRAYAQYPGGKPSAPTVFGGPLNPAAVQLNGATSMTLLSPTGSGTASPTGQQGGSGFGKVTALPKVQGPIQVSLAPTTPQSNTSGAGVVGSLQMPNIFTVSGALPLTASPSGGAIVVQLAPELPATFLAGPVPTGLAGLDKHTHSWSTGNPSTGPLTPAVNNEWALFAWRGNGGSSATPGAGWTNIVSNDDAYIYGLYDQFVPTPTPITGSATVPSVFDSEGVLILFTTPAGAPTIVQQLNGNNLLTSSFGSNVTTNNSIIVAVYEYGAHAVFTPGTITVSDTLSNAYTFIDSAAGAVGVGYGQVAVFMCPSSGGGADTITASSTSTGVLDNSIIALEVSGIASAGQVPTFRVIENSDLTNAIFGASGSSHQVGAVPDPGSSSGTTRFLREDATWHTAVTSVALTVPAIFSVAGSPITTSGTLAVTLANESANLVFAGPTSGGAAAPTFRALVNADLPLTPVFTSVQIGGATGPTWTSGTGAPSGTPTPGSIYSNISGGVGTSFYVYNGTSWVAVA